ncbi:MAG: hypothetical protein ACRDRV_04880 [Pseudonocardiaceae bacterium]
MTRTQAARPRSARIPEGHIPAGASGAVIEPAKPLPGGRLYRLLVGVDPAEGVEMSPEQVAELADPLATLLLQRGTFPATLRELVAALDAHNAEPQGVPVQQTFLVGEGSQIPWTEQTKDVARELRCVLSRGRSPEQAEVLVTTSPEADSPEAFLQLLAWDDEHGVFNYYLRLEGSTAWLFVGNSRHALEPATRGKGPFDAHVNGSVVMRELNEPWNNWHSQRAGVHDAIAPDSPLRTDPLWQNRLPADVFEKRIVRRCIGRWTKARLAAIRAQGSIEHPDWLLRQLFDTTTVNLRSTDRESATVTDSEQLLLPLTFFFNLEALEKLGIATPGAAVRVAGKLYRDSLVQYRFRLTDEKGFEQPGDTHFAFLFPEPAQEDIDVVLQCVRQGLLTARFAACALMVDFPNPVYSPRRAALLRHAPDTATITADGSDLSERTAQAIVAAAGAAGPQSPEAEFAELWSVAQDRWPAEFATRLAGYLTAVTDRLTSADGFDSYVRLAESRRRRFATTSLNEFALLLPRTDIPSDMPPLQMKPDGTVAQRPSA